MSTIWCCRAWSLAMSCARPTRMPGIRSIDTSAAKAAPGVLAVLTGADWEASGWGDLPVPARAALARRHAGVSAALSGIGQRSGALGRRLRRLCRSTDPPSGRGRRRTDRGRLRAAAGDRLDRGGRRTGRAAGLGRSTGQCCVLSYRGRCGKNRSGDRRGGACRSPPAGRQPRDRRSNGAARRHRRLQPRRRSTTRSTRPCSASTPTAPSWRPT